MLDLWPAETLPPTRTRAEWEHEYRELLDRPGTYYARYVQAKARGIAWYCPADCLTAHRPDCNCPCGGLCHQTGRCSGH